MLLDFIIMIGILVIGVIAMRWLMTKLKLEEPLNTILLVVIVITVVYFAVRFLLSLHGRSLWALATDYLSLAAC